MKAVNAYQVRETEDVQTQPQKQTLNEIESYKLKRISTRILYFYAFQVILPKLIKHIAY